MRHTPFHIFPFDNKRILGSSGPAPAPYGDMFLDDYNPQVGTYTDFGSGSHVITTGNNALTGGSGLFVSGTIIENVRWNGGNWYAEYECVHTNTNNNQFATCIGLLSGNNTQTQSVAFGPYYFSPANNAFLYIFNDTNLNSGNAARVFSQNITINVGDRVKVRGEFVESVLTVTITNLTTSATCSDSITYAYTTAAASLSYQIKPNTGRLFFLAPVSQVDIKSVKFGSIYLNRPGMRAWVDSIGSGYYQNSEAQRFINQWATDVSKTYMIVGGPGDRVSVESTQPVALGLSNDFDPEYDFILLGSNDKAIGVSDAVTFAAIRTIIDDVIANGQTANKIFVGEILPRNGVSMTGINVLINTLPSLYTGLTVVPFYALAEDTGTPGNINPSYSSDGIHPNATFATIMKNQMVTSGMT